jgi:hypothetical protein
MIPFMMEFWLKRGCAPPHFHATLSLLQEPFDKFGNSPSKKE